MNPQGFVIRTDVLDVMSRLCFAEDDGRAIAGMLFHPRELVACNGHILARVAHDLGSFGSKVPYTLRRRDIEMVVGAAKAGKHREVQLFDTGDFVELELELGARIHLVKRSAKDYPPDDQVTPKAPAPGVPPELTLDPKYLADVGALTKAVTGLTGVTVAAWGGPISPVLFEAGPVRVVVMPMRGSS